ncbi:MAG: glycosyltransferase family A protein, partial [Pseudomonadales bacterium]|nr:glycosyltransferase family A protein [Pseudomonadales bacterium]
MTGVSEPDWITQGEYIPPLVSVLVRTRDRPESLKKALNSLLAQRYPQIEVVLVNDGSTEIDPGCQEIAGKLAAFQLVRPEPGGNRVRAANAGLEAASGSYLIFLDDDDWFYPDHLAKLVSALEHETTAGLAYTGVECVRQDEAGGESHVVHTFNQSFEHTFLLLRNFIPIHAAMFRRHFVDEGLRLDASLTHYEDWDFWVQLAARTAFHYVPGISACYYLGQGSGFGVGFGGGNQPAHEDRFFAKWRKLWSAQDLRGIVDYARKVPEFRQMAHEAEIQKQEVQQAHVQTLDQLRSARAQQQDLQARHD